MLKFNPTAQSDKNNNAERIATPMCFDYEGKRTFAFLLSKPVCQFQRSNSSLDGIRYVFMPLFLYKNAKYNIKQCKNIN